MPKNLIESRRDCATCHLEWSTEFEQPQAPLLIDKPAKPQAAQEDTCLGCHDGSVGDSRKIVWREHSHKVGMKPPAEMKIPPGLPLEDGKITCRTCHTAHAVPGTEDDLGGTFFLRVDNSQSQLCQLCHGDKSGGPQHGSHPVGPMTVGLPDKLKNAGAKSGPKGQELICQSCHGAHGSKADKLLVMSTSESQLCVSCHEKIKPGMWREGAPHDHPQNPPLETDAQRQAIKDMGTHIGTGDRLVCLSCHKLHESPSPRKLLADTLKDSKLCLRCHPDRADMVASQHDLRKTAPAEKNRLGQTPDDSGPCGACHSFHQYARDRAPAKGDPTGVCTTCHDKGHVAEKKGETFAFDHPSAVPKDKLPRDLKLAVMTDELDPAKVDVACLTCHDPHKAKTTKFLRNKPDDLCGTCHTEAKTLAGKHDFTDRPELKNAQGKTAAETGKCGFCHSVHKATSNLVMWNGTKDSPQRPEQLCVQCHKTGGMAKDHPAPPFSHPMGPQPNATTRPAMAALPLFDEAGHRSATGNVACASCHNPHSDSTKSALLLRVTGSTSALCVQCHSEKKTLAGSTHDASGNPKAWPAAAQSVNHDMCMTCHRAHSNDQQRKLWAMTPAPAAAPADGVCMSCHPNQAWAKPEEIPGATLAAAPTTQPAVVNAAEMSEEMFEQPAAATVIPRGRMLHPQTMPSDWSATHSHGSLPLVRTASANASGELPAATQIGCRTCHNPHADRNTRSLLRTPDAAQPAKVCFECHNEAKSVDHSMHARTLLPPDQKNKLLCGPCHAVHAVDGSNKTKLWAAKQDPSGPTATEQRCLGCHDNQTAKRPELPKHPQVIFNLVSFASQANASAHASTLENGRISCNTCHVPHGREDLPTPPEGQTKAMRSAGKPMLRANVDRDTCATCHGDDASRMFLYFHEPERRRNVQPAKAPSDTQY